MSWHVLPLRDGLLCVLSAGVASSRGPREHAGSGTRHPLHPALVHFPVACWSLATIADVASLWIGQPAWWLAGVLMVIGTIAAVAAMGAGLFEFASIAEGRQALADARRHMLMAKAAGVAYAASLLLRLAGNHLATHARPALRTGERRSREE